MNDQNITTKEYRVFAPRCEALKASVQKLNKRATKLGVPQITVTDTGRFEDVNVYKAHPYEHEVDYVERYLFVSVTGSAPKFAGWSLAAVVEHTEEGNLLRKSPDCKVELTPFRTGAPRCDHCKTIRNRKDTFVFLHDSGDVKVIGANCIKDFLGHADPHALARWAELSYSLTECCEAAEERGECGSGCHDTRAHVETVLSYAACVIRRKGFVSGKKSRESQEAGGNVCSTAFYVSSWTNPDRRMVLGVDYFTPDDVDRERAGVARQYVVDTLGAGNPELLSDFEHNLLLACRCESVERRNIGLLAFVPEYYARQVEKREQEKRNAASSAHFGEAGKRYRKVALTYIKSAGYSSSYGGGFFHTFMTAAGETLSWKTSNGMNLDAGATVVATFTVKRHTEWRGLKQTEISRLAEEVHAPEEVAA